MNTNKPNDDPFQELRDLVQSSIDEDVKARSDSAPTGLDDERGIPPGKPVAARKPRRFFRYVAVLFLLALIGIVAAGSWWWWQLNRPVEHAAADQIITIEPGTSTQAIINRLSEIGIVRHPMLLRIHLRLTGRGADLKAGAYRFDSPISPLQALGKIQRAEVAFERVTIPEGFNRFDIAATLAEKTGLATEEEFLRLMDDTELIEKLSPNARNLEGYLFPDTYNYTEQTTPEELIGAMVGRFNEVFTPEWTARASRLRRSVHEVVTLASIIEEEARRPDERPRISSVFWNRLKIRMPLASDPTFIYAAIMARDYDGNPNQPRHRTRVTPYNTYKVAGLPPGPIASPGRASLEAALYPENTDYLYFVVSGTEGYHKFSRTSAEHDVAVAEYREQQRRQREQQR